MDLYVASVLQGIPIIRGGVFSSLSWYLLADHFLVAFPGALSPLPLSAYGSRRGRIYGYCNCSEEEYKEEKKSRLAMASVNIE